MPLIIKLDEYGVLDQVIHGPGQFEGEVYVRKDETPERVEVLCENRAFREAISGVCVYSVPVGEYRVRVTPKEGSGLAPAVTRPILVWNGALTMNIAVAGGQPLYFPATLSRGYLGR